MRFFNRLYGKKAFLNIMASLAAFLLFFLFLSRSADSLPPGLGSLQWLNEYPVSFLNDRARDITGSAAVNVPGFIVPGGLTGEGQIVAIADSGLDIGSMDDIHPDLKSQPGKMPKIVMLKSMAGRDVPDDPDGHGTHMAATIAGTGAASDGKFKGVAPGASIYFQAILNKNGKPEPPKNLQELFWPAYSAGARVHVDGWGGGSDTYLDTTAQVDEFVRNHPDFLVVFGAGNSGPSSGTITAEANSKNALTVGASVLPRPAFMPGANDTTLPTDFSSRGPAGDGRIKPELLAPASSVISARSSLVEGNLPGNPAYTRMQGTSMAAAVAGGTAALLREYFMKNADNINDPSVALIKAALINGSRPTAGGPSKAGFGTIDLAGTIIALKEGIFHVADEPAWLTQGSSAGYTFRVNDSEAPFKATLTWTDPPAEPGSSRNLVNDLDLVVQAPDGRIYYGNHFLGNNTPDRTNNVEQVYLPSPAPGNYIIHVAGAEIKQGVVPGGETETQDFALVWGQTPAESMVERVDGKSFLLEDGKSINPTKESVKNLINDSIAPTNISSVNPGSAAFLTPRRTYLVARLWQAAGVKLLKTAEGPVFTEINPEARLGGYSLASDTDVTMIYSLPPGVEVSGVVNPLDQKIRQVSANFIERDGVISEALNENGQKTIRLEDEFKSYKVSGDAVYSYEDSFGNSEIGEIPFGAGTLEELEKVLPGMPVRLRLAPSSGEVQYLLLKRQVLFGTVREISGSNGRIVMENGASFRISQEIRVKRNRGYSSISAVKPGDHVAAVIMPYTNEAIGLVAYSDVIYGKVVDFTIKDSTLYFMDDNGYYRSICLAADAVIHRWGVMVTADAIDAGNRIRISIDPSGQEAWRLDLADVFYDKNILEGYEKATGILSAREGVQYRVSGSTRFYKNGFPVMPEDIQPGEQINLEYALASPITSKILVSVNTNSKAPTPRLRASALPLEHQLLVTGRTGADTQVYLWKNDSVREEVPVDKKGGFN
ncbi:MAG: S8 family serine peptidase, partial [Desulfotomaculaceae bacterium]